MIALGQQPVYFIVLGADLVEVSFVNRLCRAKVVHAPPRYAVQRLVLSIEGHNAIVGAFRRQLHRDVNAFGAEDLAGPLLPRAGVDLVDPDPRHVEHELRLDRRCGAGGDIDEIDFPANAQRRQLRRRGVVSDCRSETFRIGYEGAEFR